MKVIYILPLVIVTILTVYLFTPTDYESQSGTGILAAYYEVNTPDGIISEDDLLDEPELLEKDVQGQDKLVGGSYADDMFLFHFFTKHKDGRKIVFTSDYGTRSCSGCSTFHEGVDNQGDSSGQQNVLALAPGPGVILTARFTPGKNQGSEVILLDSRSKVRHVFYHVSKLYVKAGDVVEAGDELALMGGYGSKGPNSFGKHIHYQMNITDDTDPAFETHVKNTTKYKKSSYGSYYVFDIQSNAIKWNKATYPAKVGFLSSFPNKQWNLVDVAEKPPETVEVDEKAQASNESVQKIVRDGITYYNEIAIANKKHKLPSTFNPGLNAEASKAMSNMLKAMDMKAYIKSEYRSYETQVTTYSQWKAEFGEEEADRISARPGYSEHQLGLAFDLTSVSGGALTDDFEKTKQFEWLSSNAHKHGFILRYPKGRESVTGYKYEPWHYRYIGPENATKFKVSRKATLEEWLAAPGGGYSN